MSASQEESTFTIDENSRLDIPKGAMVQHGLGIESLDVDDEMVLYDTLRNQSYRLNAPATEIWKRLDRGLAYEALVADFAAKDDSPQAPDGVEQTLPDFLTKLADRGLIGINQPS
ncbi:hypothetical protein GCM10009839_01890 [Catenulispora yoronensis]|uniref:PqqD family protein n=1 Tax=Catenulispora yoronensis TaxID=450799 RepID=A0ABN2TJ95_9ACTN